MGDDFFAGVEQSEVEISTGSCTLPILYRAGSVVGVMYRLEPEVVAAVLPHAEHFEPFRLMGKAVVQLVVFEYRDTTIGPYNEVALAVEVKRRGSSPSTWGALMNAKNQPDYGSLFLNLPVTSEGACAAGREIWGFPKYVVDIETSFTDEGVWARQGDEFELSIGQAKGPETPGIPFVLMSIHEARMLRTIVETGHRLRWGGAGSVALSLTGTGPTADNIRALGLHETTPSLVWRAREMRSILPAGEPLPNR